MTISPPETRDSLILRLQDAADIAAWDEFVEIYAPVIYRVARRIGLQPADSDDVVQTVLSAVARSIEGWIDRNDRGSFRAWLFRIARNTAIDFLTRRKHRPWAEGGEANFQLDELQAPCDVSSQFDLEMRCEIYTRAAEEVKRQVSESTWQAFHHTAILGRSIEETARQLSVSQGSVYISRSRVMKRLQSLVKRIEKYHHD